MLRYFTYQLPFKKPFKTSHHQFLHRDGIILQYEQDGIVAYGEIAPLPGFSDERLQDVLTVLKLNRPFIVDALKNKSEGSLLQALSQIHEMPSLIFGLDTLFHDYNAKIKGVTLKSYLGFTDIDRPKVNGTIGIGDLETSLEQAKKLIDEGFDTLKLKVGTNISLERETLKELRSAFPKVKIRVDANEAWDLSTALKNLEALSIFDIEYCEQPLSKWALEDAIILKTKSPIKIAADEAVRNSLDAHTIIEKQAADIIIVKPMLFGSLKDIIVTKKLAQSHDIELVFTTSLESIIGRITTSVLAAELGSKEMAHGLSTGKMLEMDLSGFNELNSGHYNFSRQPGIGLSLTLDKLQEVTY